MKQFLFPLIITIEEVPMKTYLVYQKNEGIGKIYDYKSI